MVAGRALVVAREDLEEPTSGPILHALARQVSGYIERKVTIGRRWVVRMPNANGWSDIGRVAAAQSVDVGLRDCKGAKLICGRREADRRSVRETSVVRRVDLQRVSRTGRNREAQHVVDVLAAVIVTDDGVIVALAVVPSTSRARGVIVTGLAMLPPNRILNAPEATPVVP